MTATSTTSHHTSSSITLGPFPHAIPSNSANPSPSPHLIKDITKNLMKRKAVSSPKSKLKPLRGLKSNSNCWKNKTPNSNTINKTSCTEFKCSNTKSPHSRISYPPHTLSTTTTKCTSTTQCPTRNQHKKNFPNKILWVHHAAPAPKPSPKAHCSSNCYWSAMNRGSSMR